MVCEYGGVNATALSIRFAVWDVAGDAAERDWKAPKPHPGQTSEAVQVRRTSHLMLSSELQLLPLHVAGR